MAVEEMTPGRRLLRKAADIAGFTKCGIALASAFASAVAYLLTGYIGSPERIAGTAAAVFLLAAGAGALNNWQDRAEDAGMERTRKRPLPSGRVNPNTALLTAAVLIAAGEALLAVLSAEAAAAGIAAVGLYNGIYTPLKLRTAWAVIPGIAAGISPALIGWLAAGSPVFSSVLFYLVILFGVWQLPHLWILSCRWKADYTAQGVYGLAGLLDSRRMSRVVFLWVFCLAVLMIYAPLFIEVRSDIITMLLLMNALCLILYFMTAASRKGLKTAGFALLNTSVFAHTGIIALSHYF